MPWRRRAVARPEPGSASPDTRGGVMRLLVLAMSAPALLACAPATLGMGDMAAGDGGPGGPTSPAARTQPSPPPPPPLVSCGDGAVMAGGSTMNGPYAATAMRVTATACTGASNVAFSLAGNNDTTWDVSFNLKAEFLDGGGVRLPLGTATTTASVYYRPSTATVTITAADDAYWQPDAGATPHVTGTFEVH